MLFFLFFVTLRGGAPHGPGVRWKLAEEPERDQILYIHEEEAAQSLLQRGDDRNFFLLCLQFAFVYLMLKIVSLVRVR